MINKDRIVPIQKCDFLSMVGIIMNIASVSYDVLEADDINGAFTVANTGVQIANQPVQSMNFTAASATVYFVPAYDYDGMSVSGTAVTPTGDVDADGITLYKAVLDSGAITITAVTPEV